MIYLAPERKLLNRVMKKAVRRRLGLTSFKSNEHWIFILRVGITQPLNSRDTNDSIENAIPERQTLTHIVEHHISIDTILDVVQIEETILLQQCRAWRG